MTHCSFIFKHLKFYVAAKRREVIMIKIEHLVKNYGSICAVDDISFSVEKGEIIERGSHEDLLELKGRYYELYTGMKELD